MKRKNQNGFSTIELVVALVVLGILVTVGGAAINEMTVINNRARDLALVNLIAQNKIELLRSAGYNSIAIGTVDFSSELPSELASPKTAHYTVTSPITGEKEITVSVTYHEYKRDRTLIYKGLISELGVAQ